MFIGKAKSGNNLIWCVDDVLTHISEHDYKIIKCPTNPDLIGNTLVYYSIEEILNWWKVYSNLTSHKIGKFYT